MTTRIRRWVLIVLAASAVYVGAWAVAAPLHWYHTFPGGGRAWLPPLGPYNQHLASDVGGLYLALGVLSVGAALRPADGYLVRLTGLSWTAFSAPHLTYHLGHLAHYGPADRILNAVLLSAVLLAALALLLPHRPRPHTADRTIPAVSPLRSTDVR